MNSLKKKQKKTQKNLTYDHPLHCPQNVTYAKMYIRPESEKCYEK